MKEVIRVRCPVCGMMTDLEQIKNTEQNKPTEVRLFLQQFGGKLKQEGKSGEVYKKKKRGSAPGYMEYIDITDQNPSEVNKFTEWFIFRAKRFLGIG